MTPLAALAPLKLAIVGSQDRYLTEAQREKAQRIVQEILEQRKPALFISGGAEGVDSIAEVEARRLGIPVQIERPTNCMWDGPGGFKERNLRIAVACDELVRIVAHGTRTYGSGWTRDRAAAMGKPTKEIVL